MSRILRVAAAQMGATQLSDTRKATLGRMVALLEEAAKAGAKLVVFPELAFTTFFPRWLIAEEDLDAYFEQSMPNANVEPLFDRARALGVGFYVGYAELTPGHIQYQAIAMETDRTGLRDAVSEAFAVVIADGTYKTILTKYGLQDNGVAAPVLNGASK